jgi:hypothetical protein
LIKIRKLISLATLALCIGSQPALASNDELGQEPNRSQAFLKNQDALIREMTTLHLAEGEAEIIMEFSKGMWHPGGQPRQTIKNYLMVRGGLGLLGAAEAVKCIYEGKQSISDVLHEFQADCKK